MYIYASENKHNFVDQINFQSQEVSNKNNFFFHFYQDYLHLHVINFYIDNIRFNYVMLSR